MALKLQCEICGGRLVGKPGGVFECENCGAGYSTAWAKEKLRAATGTGSAGDAAELPRKVRVEGGTVRLDSSADRDALLQRGRLALEDGEWEKATGFFDLALNLDPKCAEAYLGLAMAEEKCRNKIAFLRSYEASHCALRLKNSGSLKRARQFSTELDAQFAKLDEEGEKADAAADEEKKKAMAETLRRLSAIRRKTALTMRMIGAASHTVGLRSDGTACAVGWNEYRQCEVSDWTGLTAIAAGGQATLGLLADGTVIAAGNGEYGQCEVSGWTDITAVSVGSFHAVGLLADGTAVSTKYTAAKKGRPDQEEDDGQPDGEDGEELRPVPLREDGSAVNVDCNDAGQCEVSGWTELTAVSAGAFHTVGLRADGTVLATRFTGNPAYDFGQCEVSGWTDVVAVAAGKLHTVALRADGTVAAVGANVHGQCELSDWTDMVAVSAGDGYTVGLRADGTVSARGVCGNLSDWTGIVAVAAGESHTVGLRADGSVVAAGLNICGECEVSDWKLFNSMATLETERKAAAERAIAERKAAAERAEAERRAKREALDRERAALRSELANLKGLFSGRRRREIEARLASIETKLEEPG